MTQKDWFLLFTIILIIALIVSGIEWISRSIHGCTNEILSDFKSLKLAKDYQEIYIHMIKSDELTPLGVDIESSWIIKNYEDGCKVYLEASYFLAGTYTYQGDEFFINLDERKVYPLDKSSRMFIEDFGHNTKLP